MHWQKLFLILVLVCSVFLSIPSLVLADGMLVPPDQYWVHQRQQQAVLFHQDGVETMVISVQFQGNARDFAWIVPIPSKPEVQQERMDLFDNLSNLTEPLYRVMPFGNYLETTDKQSLPGVTVWETKKIDIFDVSIISSTTTLDLQRWLMKNSYNYPEGHEFLLQDYVNKDWFFVAIKVDTSVNPEVANERLKTGHATPLKFTFETPQLIYPMKLTGVTFELISAEQSKYSSSYLPLTLYVFSDHKVEFPGSYCLYAGWLLPKDIRNLSVHEDGSFWAEPKQRMFLTKLSRNYYFNEMTEDLVLTKAEDNSCFGRGKWFVFEPWKIWIGILIPLWGEIYFLAKLKQKERMRSFQQKERKEAE